MKNLYDYSLYECPFSHLEKDCGHELHGPEGFVDDNGNLSTRVWCACGFRGPVLYLDPEKLGLKRRPSVKEIDEAISRIEQSKKEQEQRPNAKEICDQCGCLVIDGKCWCDGKEREHG